MDSINSFSDNLKEEHLWEIEDALMSGGESKDGKGGKSKKRGHKTTRAIANQNKEDAERNRKEESRSVIEKSLIQFPESDNPNVQNQNIDKYADWVVESIKIDQPVIDMNDLEYNQHRAGGPGGQNVNKVSNAVFYKHTITGLFANASKERSTVDNRNYAASSLFKSLGNLCKHWKIFLKDVSNENLDKEIRTFVEGYFNKSKTPEN